MPLSAVESGVVCLGSSASREGRYLRGVITQADGNVVKVGPLACLSLSRHVAKVGPLVCLSLGLMTKLASVTIANVGKAGQFVRLPPPPPSRSMSYFPSPSAWPMSRPYWRVTVSSLVRTGGARGSQPKLLL